MIYLNLFLLLNQINFLIDKYDLGDLAEDLKSLELLLKTKLNGVLKEHFRKSGMLLNKNIYVGYDTEYQNKDSLTNTIISAQIALLARFVIKVPKVNRVFKFQELDVDKNLFYDISLSKDSNIN